ncbi:MULTISPECIES: histidine--tRNA ligase [Clostridium]|uniref:histidine--tRNA ligase n=1 Tax=Clostridium TaxID=1485 RepID=UPI0018AB9E76|nr:MULTISPECIES: histidine--tRNA ligase [Clostridium]MDB1934942.1 histidine--tRNA ligase [Clostridium tertium]MDB1938826.1 histidine--tRNA ligase [Clostridium tertium]MDB1969134.1 histidine--tRNA ligase [Clostridium tertium]MDU4738620.1 histidine--tRNA ligase [Clostridium sp.]
MSNYKIKPSILPGFMELLPIEQRKFNDIVEKITKVYEENGCLPIDTPIIEKAEILLAKNAGETEKQVYAFQKGSSNLALRFDLTVPFARYTSQYFNDLTFPFKRYQIGKVYRGERNQRGRYREFYQCDVDIIGKDKLSIKNDALVISLASKAFKSIGLKDYKFQISNRKILSALLSSLNIESSIDVMILIDKYDKIGEQTFKEELDKLVNKESAKIINKVININGSKDKVLEELELLNIQDEKFILGLNELKEVTTTLEVLGVYDSEYIINLKIIRGLDYYTGTVFETLLINNEEYGSICSGGRYDNLAENYTNNILPGVGISIGLTRLFFVLKEIGFVESYKLPSKVEYLIIPIGDTLKYCGEVYKKLTESGKAVEMYFEDDKLKKKLNYANKLEIPYVILLGEEEEANKSINIKNMITRKQETLKFEDIF